MSGAEKQLQPSDPALRSLESVPDDLRSGRLGEAGGGELLRVAFVELQVGHLHLAKLATRAPAGKGKVRHDAVPIAWCPRTRTP